MSEKSYPLHPGQTHVEPYYCTIPLEEYEHLKKIEKLYNARQVKIVSGPGGNHVEPSLEPGQIRPLQ